MRSPSAEPTLRRPASLDEALAELAAGGTAVAGGTELVPLLHEGLLPVPADGPLALVDVRDVVPRAIERGRVGAGATLAELERSELVPRALAEACRLAASPQLRHAGTLGGNLLQSTRCWYWRLGADCFLRGGDRCHAADGEHREHAFLATAPCASAHPSDPAAALLALGASVRTDRRSFPLEDLYRLPTADDRRLARLEPGELVLSLDVPEPDASTYLKAMDRGRFAFALVGVAAARFGSDVRLALAGAAPIPWRLSSPDDLDRAAPLAGTAYKLEVARALVARALDAVR